jgi:hypothetical protein
MPHRCRHCSAAAAQPWAAARAFVIAFVLQVDECDAEVRLAIDADEQPACKPTQNVRQALAKLEGLLQSWRAAVQETQVCPDLLPKS